VIMSVQTPQQRITLPRLRAMKQAREPIVALTAYDYSFARLLDAAGIDLVLVGDSLGMVVQGHETTIPVGMDDMVYHTRLVARGLRHALLVMDLPFMSYTNPAQALVNAARALQEGGAQMVKLEGGERQVEVVRALAEHDIPVCAHIGLKPQSIHKLGGYRVQGREADAALRMLEDAAALEEAGADLLLLECVPATLAAEITANSRLPVIGIGAGSDVDGQILVLQDVLGITPGQPPRFARDFMAEAGSIAGAIADYAAAVRDRRFPATEHGFK